MAEELLSGGGNESAAGPPGQGDAGQASSEPGIAAQSPDIPTGAGDPGVQADLGAVPGANLQNNAGTVKWFDDLPDDLKGNERITKFESREAALKAFAEAKLAPDLPEKYTLPQGANPKWSDWAKANNMTQDHLNSVISVMANMEKTRNTQRDNSYSQGVNELFKVWGDKKDEKIQNANRVFKAVPSGNKALDLIKKSKEGNNPVIVEFLSDIGSMLGEGGFLRPGQSRESIPENAAHLLFPNDAPKNPN